MATKMLSLSGSANAATAAAPATVADTTRSGLLASEHSTPTKARMPAKPSPQAVGITLASAMPIRLQLIHAP